MAKQTTPRLVKEVPKGYKEEVRDGKKVYVKKTETPIPKTPIPVTPKPTNYKPSGTPKRLPPPRPKPVEPDFKDEEDVVYLDEPVVEPVQKVQSLRTDMKEIFPDGLQKGYKSYMVPDLTSGGGYTKQKNVITDSEGFPVVYDFKTNQYSKTGEPTIHSTMPVQNDTPTIQDALAPNELPTKFDVVPERLRVPSYNKAKVTTPTVDESIYKGFNEVGNTNNALNDIEFKKEQDKNLAIPKLNKGGIVSKIKGYANAGVVTENPYLSGNPNIQGQGTQFTNSGNAKGSDNFYSAFGAEKGANSGVIGQADVYGKAKADEEQKNKDEKDAKNSAMKSSATNAITSGLGAYGKSYALNAQDTGSQDSATKSAMGAVSNMGAIGGVVAGAYGIVDGIARPEKNKAEKMDITYDSQGNATAKLKSTDKAKDNAIIGSFLSPSEALTTRMSYEGGLTDISGYGYTKHLEKEAQKQLDVYNKANQTDKQNQAVAAREAGNLNASINTMYNLRGTSFNDAKQLEGVSNYKKGGIVSKIQMCADGGKIVGKGGPKEDKILAKVEADSFIVPAENAEVAEELREKYLGKPPKQKANLNVKGGETVKLSNGEHKFSPEEKHELLEKGVNVDLLAPNSEVKAVEKKSHIMFPNVIGYENGGLVKGTKYNGATWDGKNWISESGNKYSLEGGKKFTDGYNQSVAKTKSNEETRKASEINLYSRKLKEATDAGNTEEANRLQSKINSLTGTKKETPATETKPMVKVPKSGTTVKASPKVTVENLPSKDIALTELKNDAELRANAAAIDQEKSIANAPTRQAVINDANKANNDAYVSSNPTQRKGGIMDKIGNIDPTSLIGIGQMALGKNMLSDSKRPVDKAVLDATYNANVNRSLEDAKFGLTPEQRFAAEQDIQNSLNDARFAARSKGFSASDTLNQERASINDAWKAKLGLKVADTDLRMQKQKYADAMAADRASILASNRRQAYNDAMGTFQQNQSAGSELIGAGLQNTIGAYRYNKMMKQQDEINAASNPWLNYKA